MVRLYGHAARILLMILLFNCENVLGEKNSGFPTSSSTKSSSEEELPTSLSTESTSEKGSSQNSITPLTDPTECNTVPSEKLTQPKSEVVRTKKSTSLRPAKTTALDYNRIPEPGLSFQHLRDEKRIFVDKTKFLEYLLDRGAIFYFVARPTRFGKTIFSQMTSSFFKGEKDNFVGLSIYNRGNGVKRGEWVEYPVIYLDFSVLALQRVFTVRDFDNKLTSALFEIAKTSCLKYTKKDFLFSHMVSDLKKQKGFPVVILIDEYDLPIRTALKRQNQNLAREIQDYLTGFFAEIKGCVLNLKLVLVSGVSRLSINGFTYGGNVFVDLTHDKNFHDAMGLTGSDVHKDDFKPFTNKLASCEGMMLEEYQCGSDMEKSKCIARVKEDKKKFWLSLNQWYDGYKFVPSAKGLLNPISVFECLRRKKLGSYWKTEDSVNLFGKELAKKKLTWNFYENYQTTGKNLFSRFDIDSNKIPLPVEMLMNGLLTIKCYYQEDDLMVLDFPNEDIREAVREKVDQSYAEDGTKPEESRYPPKTDLRLFKSLQKGDMKEVIKVINEFFDPKVVRPEKMEESQLTTMLLNFFKTSMVTYKPSTDVKHGKRIVGDIDMQTVGLAKNYIIEVKVTESGDWEAVEKFVKYSKADGFQAAIGFQDDVHLLGLQFHRDPNSGQYRILNWVLIPYHYPSIVGGLCLNFEEMICSNPTIKTKVDEMKKKWEK